MAENIVDISKLCPIKWRKQGYTNPAPYNTKYHDEWNYPDTIPNFIDPVEYLQPWQKNDIIPIPLLSNFGPHQLELYNCARDLVQAFVLTYKPSSIEGIGVKAYEAAISLSGYDEGVYYFLLKSGNPVIGILESEQFDIKELHENSILFQYKHDENDFDVVFETGIELRFRVHGGLTEFTPVSDRTVFIDQPRNIVQLSGKSYYTQKLLIGDSLGVPQWVIERVNDIFLCSEVLIDGRQFVANEGAKVEANREELYPMAGWALEVRPANAKKSKRFISIGDPGGPVTTVVYNIEQSSSLFGTFSDPASTNIIKVLSNE
ncbi:MAG TPA: hypothetical protein VMZ03_03895 [Chitinophagaceae bacterium]|nr:hypothetical protein [Chitinophagaceae bacterium]